MKYTILFLTIASILRVSISAEDILLKLYDINGRSVLESNIENPFMAEQLVTLSTGRLRPGIYFYQLEYTRNRMRLETRLNKVIKTEE